MDSLCLNSGLHGVIPAITAVGNGGCGGVVEVRATASAPSQKRGPFGFSFKYPLTPFWSRGGGGGIASRRRSGLCLDDAVLVDSGDSRKPIAEETAVEMDTERRNGSWVLKILDVQSTWKHGEEEDDDEVEDEDGDEDEEVELDDAVVSEDDGGCDVCSVLEDDGNEANKFQLDRESFSKLLRRVTLPESKLYAQLSYLGNLAYSISKIKPANLSKYYGLRFVTSSAEKTESALKAENGEVSGETKPIVEAEEEVEEEEKNKSRKISASAAYEIVASAASYLHSRTNNILPFNSSSKAENSDKHDVNLANAESSSDVAYSVTSVVAAEEDVKQAVADDLKSTISSPCDWFICDDDQSHTRFVVIQGSESLASWQANLLFEPIEFEGLGAIVHRGIYEAAKGMYEQMLPEVKAHIKTHGTSAKFRFTGHSLGGSLSLLLNLMLLVRGEVPASSLLPVITYGAPFVLCGGDRLLKKLGLPKSHVQAIVMHRDIVPRAFSCNYPYHVAELLKAVNGNFRSHPCLNKQSMLYSPMGELLILQPDETFSPGHELLPSGNGLYLLTSDFESPDIEDSDEERLRASQTVFLNTPHPLDILSDRSAYGSSGTIQRDHDMNSYLKAVRSVIRKEVNQIRRAKREHRRSLWWPILVARESGSSGIAVSNGQINGQDFSGMMQTGRKSLQRFSRLVASQHMPLIVVMLFPVKLLFLGAFNVFSFR
ncbi:Fungal lipase-like domain [Arabidopsis suecica]|uniref:Fungal lipase-like domain n=1 Tax=Arabidopsis suecica TaxID=45249 RepID=A0A8T2GYJ1_ARASU|nr:Fungal lipase-like domain [Arabidopsis suecica]